MTDTITLPRAVITELADLIESYCGYTFLMAETLRAALAQQAEQVPSGNEPCQSLCDVPCGKADYQSLLREVLTHFYHDGVPVDTKHPKRITVTKIEKALNEIPTPNPTQHPRIRQPRHCELGDGTSRRAR